MDVTVSRAVARGLIGLIPLGAVGTAAAGDQVAATIFGAGAGAIIGHTVGGPDVAVVGGIIGAAAGAAIAAPRVVHYRGPHPGYGPPVYHRPPRGPVYVVPPPVVVFVLSRGHGYWHDAYDAWGRPIRTWVPAPGYRRHYAPPPRPHYHRHYPRHNPRW